jgi:hypothetical protein
LAYRLIDLKDHLVSLVPYIATLMLVAIESILYAVVEVNLVLLDWELLKDLMQ